MNILGIKPSFGKRGDVRYWGRHDPGACLLEDDTILAIAEEERFTRDKYGRDTFPTQSIEYVLDEADLQISDIDKIAIGRQPKYYSRRLDWGSEEIIPAGTGSMYDYLQSVSKIGIAQTDAPIEEVDETLEAIFGEPILADYTLISHHRCHAASALYCSEFDNAAVLTVDGAGEYDSTVLWNSDVERLRTYPLGNSIGGMYSVGARYLGYRSGKDAGKVMGLAPYGDCRDEFNSAFDELVSIDDGEYDLRTILDTEDPIAVYEEYFGERRTHPDPFTQRHKDFAFHLQRKTEELLVSVVEDLLKRTGESNLAVAGGVVMNCKANRVLHELDDVDNLFIQPAANDSGICLGAALEAYAQETGMAPDPVFEHVYYGPEYGPDEIEETLQTAKIQYETGDVCAKAAQMLADGKLVGWFQGRMEYGARALGNRSILADPRDKDSLDRVNAYVKSREAWRPFAPSILNESRKEYLKYGDEAPYMILADEVREGKQAEVPAIVHVDGSTRPQTVREETNEKYYRLISAFEERTGVPVLLNTSFNVSGEPIVESPKQAIRDFYATGLDSLVIGDYVVTK